MLKWVRGYQKSLRYLPVLGLCALLAGCSNDGNEGPAFGGANVNVIETEYQTVPILLNYIAQTESVATVDIQARVEGYLLERPYAEGDDINSGDLLFVIDPRPFQAAVDAAEADVLNNKANLDFQQIEYERMAALIEDNIVSREQYDQSVAQRDQAMAQLELSQANLEMAELNLSYTQMHSPVDGRVGRSFVDVGNLVGADTQTRLATVVQLDPMRVLFSPNERDYLRIIDAKNRGDDLDVIVTLTSNDQQVYHGKVDFIDNTIDPSTATLLMRALVDNPNHALLPGMYVNVTLHLTDDPQGILVPPEAVQLGQGFEFVYVVDEDNIARQTTVETGQMYQHGRVILSGLDAGQTVIVDNFQMVRPGAPVNPQTQTEMSANTTQLDDNNNASTI